ncbi:polysaccharide pyruvyl transferase family protein [Paenochrobactrum pullorum]|uniref:polysaccharide pyruvyl transferase family protein n=1 Tax=Paenochrobactrum pullorum TaxID=1324351 RepID=UPI0035BC6172
MIYIAGGAGVPNFGDELMARYWLDKLSQYSDVTFAGVRSKVLNSLFSNRFPNVHFSGALRNVIARSSADFWEAFRDGANALRSGVLLSMPVEEVERLMSASIFHLHGGGYINSKWPKHAFYLGLALALKEKNGCKLIATGIGLTPIQTPPDDIRPIFERALEAFDVFEVRDQESYDFIMQYDNSKQAIHNGLDDTFITPVTPITPVHNHRTLHVSLYNNEDADRVIERIPPRFIESFDLHKFWLCTPQDAIQFAKIAKRYPFFSALTLETMIFENLPVSRLDFMITARFHPHLMASRAGSNGAYRAPTDYYKVKHGSIVALGSSFELTQMSKLKHNIDLEPTISLNEHSNVRRKEEIINKVYAK